MGLITYDDKDKTLPVGVPRHQVRDVDMNELKDTINENWEAFLAAVGDDLDFAASIALALSLKANIANPTFTTRITTPLVKITGGSPGANKFLMSDADGDGSWESVPVGSLSGVLPIENGGNGTTSGISSNAQAAIDAKVADNLTASGSVAPSKNAVNTALALKAAFLSFAKRVALTGTQNGVNNTFGIPQPIVLDSEEFFRNGSLQVTPGDYTISGQTITTVVPPESWETLRTNYIRP
jgi:hypothetical protein